MFSRLLGGWVVDYLGAYEVDWINLNWKHGLIIAFKKDFVLTTDRMTINVLLACYEFLNLEIENYNLY